MNRELEENTVISKLGYAFTDRSLLTTALTHRSYRNENKHVASDNERLEFLGDSILGMCVANLLFDAYPTATEGELTRFRSELVREEGLETLAVMLEVGAALRLGKGEESSGGRTKSRLLSSALEAIVGAVMCDGGLSAVMGVTERLFQSRVSNVTADRDAKSELQELIQRAHSKTPAYVLNDTSGPDHERIFHVSVCVDEETLAKGSGRSKARAEQAAASTALRTLDRQTASIPQEHQAEAT